MKRIPRWVAPAVVVLALAGSAQALGAVPSFHVPRFHRGLSRAQILRTARASHRVIVVLKSQQTGRLDSASSVRTRRAAQALERQSLIAGIDASGSFVTRQFTVLNGFAATVSTNVQERLAADPGVAAVIPDAMVRPIQAPATSGSSGLTPASADPGNPTTPQSGICPTDPAKPLLEPEALQTMHVAFNDQSTPQAANLATGAGVKVAFFADGVDINNPDFIRPDGSHVFMDYRDFTGDGPNAPSGAAEAFGDSSSIAAQGRQVYDLSNFVNPAHPLPPGCNIRVRGVAPGASLIGMKVFGAGGSFVSVIIQGLDWAVTQDHADILSESFGGYAMPDTALDAVKLFNDAAVRSGVTVSQGTNDAGATEGPTSPATDPNVIDTAATTNFRAYAQTASYAFQFSGGTWLNDNISSIGGGGFSQNADTPDVSAPGEADWALCSPNVAVYQDCTDFKGAATSLEQFGGVSQSTPLTAGAAALVIQAYRSAHQGNSPSPALVKQILLSTANDLGLPTQEEGTGEVDALKAVQAAMSVDGGTPTGHSLLIGPSKLTFTQDAGTPAHDTFSVTNTGATTQTVTAHARALNQTVSDTTKDVTLGTTPMFIDQFGSARPYVTTTFTIPDGTDRLLASDAWSGPGARVGLTLIDPTGAYAAYTRPQGNGDHGQVDVRKPVGGTWTAIVFRRDGTFTGTVHLEFATQNFSAVDSISPSSRTLTPGETGQFRFQTTMPSAPGDSAHDLVVSDSSGDSTVVPVVLRSLVPTNAHGGTFDGTLFGGNGREFVAQTDTFQFDVPKKSKSLSVSLSWPDNAGTEVIGWLIDPHGTLLGSSSSLYVDPSTGGATFTHGLEAFALSPQAGRWKFVVTVASPVGGTVLSTPYHGVVSFDPPQIRASGLPEGNKVKAGQPITATVRVANTGPGTMNAFADPRRADRSETDALAPLFASATVPLPGTNVPSFLVPTQADAVVGAAQGTQPIGLELGYGELGEGDPDLLGISQGNNAAASFSGPPELSNGTWFLAPSLRGPFDAAASGSATVGMLAHMKAFDRNANSTTGDWWRVLIDANAPDWTPLQLGPGQSGTMTVTFTPQGKHGDKVKGVLYVDDFSLRILTGNEQIAFPYSYKIK
jgi:Subtilase family/Peptidase inhibitor I9